MEVYFVEEIRVANGESGSSIRLFKNKKDAEDIFVGWCYQARTDMQSKDTCEDDIYTDTVGTTYFSIYEYGFYERNHIDIKFGKRKIEE